MDRLIKKKDKSFRLRSKDIQTHIINDVELSNFTGLIIDVDKLPITVFNLKKLILEKFGSPITLQSRSNQE